MEKHVDQKLQHDYMSLEIEAVKFLSSPGIIRRVFMRDFDGKLSRNYRSQPFM